MSFSGPTPAERSIIRFRKGKKTRPHFFEDLDDLSTQEIDEILGVVQKYYFIDGFVVGNLAKRRGGLQMRSSKERLDLLPYGGISGGPIKDLSTNIIRHIYRRTNGKYIIIGLGGVFAAEDAYEKIKAGASLVQIITGLIYGGPMAVKRINRGLVALLARDGYTNVSEAVGAETR